MAGFVQIHCHFCGVYREAGSRKVVEEGQDRNAKGRSDFALGGQVDNGEEQEVPIFSLILCSPLLNFGPTSVVAWSETML
jgi:hypothetical protein